MAERPSVLPLFVWLSPAFPVGGFAYSQGLEWAVEAGSVADAASLRAWLADLLTCGAIRADGVLLAAAWRAADIDALLEVNDLALALTPSRERRLETASQGSAFLAAVVPAWPAPGLAALASRDLDEIAYPVAVGAAAAAHGLALRPTLDAFAMAAVANLVSAALRLGPIGQSDAQAIMAGLSPLVLSVAAEAETSRLHEIGTSAWRADIASMRHETQYSRLFRS